MKKTVFPLALSALACAAQAATITVDSTDDSLTATTGICTLRGAVDAINNGADQSSGCVNSASDGYGSDDTIEFDPSLAGKTIEVRADGQITISSNLIIRGLLDASEKPDITLNSNDNRIFEALASVSSLTIIGVRFTTERTNRQYGGAILVNANNSILDLNHCMFENNIGSYGGAVFTYSSININHSTFRNNQATNGGAVYASGTAIISNSIFSGNRASGNGGAIIAYANTIISNSTFSGNMANGNGGAAQAPTLNARHLTLLNNTAVGSGQALYVSSSSTLHNSIIIGNNSSAQCAAGSTFTGSHNLEGWAADETSTFQGASSATCGTSSPVSGGSVALNTIIDSTLDDNGGPTQTLELSVDSTAIRAADANTSQMWDFTTGNWIDATLDQRGYGRLPAADGRSIGAYEYEGLGFTPNALPDGWVGEYYDFELMSAVSGGASPVTFEVGTADLPDELTLNSEGLLSGTPTVAETVFFDVTVSDSRGRSVTKSLSLTISPRALPGEPGDAASIPALPAPLLPLLAALVGTAAFVRQRRR